MGAALMWAMARDRVRICIEYIPAHTCMIHSVHPTSTWCILHKVREFPQALFPDLGHVNGSPQERIPYAGSELVRVMLHKVVADIEDGPTRAVAPLFLERLFMVWGLGFRG